MTEEQVELAFGVKAKLRPEDQRWVLFGDDGIAITDIAAEPDGKLDIERLNRCLLLQQNELERKLQRIRHELNAVYALRLQNKMWATDKTTRIVTVMRETLPLYQVLVAENRTRVDVNQGWYAGLLEDNATELFIYRGQIISLRTVPNIKVVGKIDFDTTYAPSLLPHYLTPEQNINPKLIRGCKSPCSSLEEAKQIIDGILDTGVLQLGKLNED